MEKVYYIFLNESQIREFIIDAVASIGYNMIDQSNEFYDYDINLSNNNTKLIVECIIKDFCLDEAIEYDDNNNLSFIDLILLYKKQNKNILYFRLYEEKIKIFILEELKKWKRTIKLAKLPFLKIKFIGRVNENLTCLITASKHNIDEKIEQKIIETKMDFAIDLNDLKVNKFYI